MQTPLFLSLLLILALNCGLRIMYAASTAPVDDAYITYRYARNLAAGHGFVYNLGERVLGTSTPLFTLMLVPAAGLGLPLDRTAVVLGIAADLLTALLLFHLLARRFGSSTGLLGAYLFSTFYAVAAAAGYGMEAPIFVLLLMAAIVAADADRWNLTAIWAGLAAWMRPEGFVLALLLGATLALKRRPLGRPLLVFTAVIAPWLLFATFYFGSPIPQSVVAKAAQTGISTRDWAVFFVARNPVFLLLWAGTAAGAVISFRRRDLGTMLLGLWAAAYLLFFLVGRPSFLGLWYFPPLGPPLAGLSAVAAVAIGFELDRLYQGAARSGQRRPGLKPERRQALPAILVAAIWSVLVLAVLPRSLHTGRGSKAAAERAYLPAARWVSAATTEQDLVFVSDIGYIGYFSGRKILDASGLVSPEVTRYYRERPHDRYRDVYFVLERRPKVVLLPMQRDVYSRFRDAGFWQAYEPVARFHVGGATELRPAEDPGLKGRRHAFPDFIAYVRKDSISIQEP